MSVEQVMQLSVAEVNGWVSYFEFVAKEQKKAMKTPRRR
tara:strand:+ start:607 stop:723 length:117 start_codon:yes stop_codon:yes gene_type:complete